MSGNLENATILLQNLDGRLLIDKAVLDDVIGSGDGTDSIGFQSQNGGGREVRGNDTSRNWCYC